MRKTLIFKNVNEEDNESWNDTERIIIDLVNRHLKIDLTDKIERVHRTEKKLTHTHGQPANKGRYIFCKLANWKVSEMVKEGFKNLNIKNPNLRISVTQMFSKDVTEKRNNAMKLRKTLIAEKKIVKAHLVFPAKLMVKRNGDSKGYELYQEF